MPPKPSRTDASESISYTADTFTVMLTWELQIPPSFHTWQAYEDSWVQLILWLDWLSNFSGNAASLRVSKHENTTYSITV